MSKWIERGIEGEPEARRQFEVEPATLSEPAAWDRVQNGVKGLWIIHDTLCKWDREGTLAKRDAEALARATASMLRYFLEPVDEALLKLDPYRGTSYNDRGEPVDQTGGAL